MNKSKFNFKEFEPKLKKALNAFELLAPLNEASAQVTFWADGTYQIEIRHMSCKDSCFIVLKPKAQQRKTNIPNVLII